MRTFINVKLLGTGIDGATGAKHNKAALVRNGSGTNTITFQCINPEGSIVHVGPISMLENTFITWPTTIYGFTASSANVSVYELF